MRRSGVWDAPTMLLGREHGRTREVCRLSGERSLWGQTFLTEAINDGCFLTEAVIISPAKAYFGFPDGVATGSHARYCHSSLLHAVVKNGQEI